MKYRITKDDFDKLSDDMKKEYKKNGDDYVLTVEGETEAEINIRKAKENEKAEHAATKKELAELKKAKEAETEASQKKTGDVEALEKSYKEKAAKVEAEHAAQLKSLRDRISTGALNEAVGTISKGLFNPKGESLAARVIRERLSVEFDDKGEVSVRVLDAKGQPSASTFDDFRKELLQNPELSPILLDTKASGGRPSPLGTAVPSAVAPPSNPPAYGSMSTSQLHAHIAAQRAAEGQ